MLKATERSSEVWPCSISLFRVIKELVFFFLCSSLWHCINLQGFVGSFSAAGRCPLLGSLYSQLVLVVLLEHSVAPAACLLTTLALESSVVPGCSIFSAPVCATVQGLAEPQAWHSSGTCMCYCDGFTLLGSRTPTHTTTVTLHVEL